MLEIIHEDEYLVAINKPHGLLVHRTGIAADVQEFALQLLRDQLNRWVSPVHRIDRKTAGVLLFAKNKETEVALQKMFMNGGIGKKYLAIVRGFAPDALDIDYPLKRDDGTMQEAFTSIKTLDRVELPIAFGQHATSRYSVVEAIPTTGRMHQLRKHFAHINHPIIGDRPHGCNKQNKFFKEQWGMTTMLLHASSQEFTHPVTQQILTINAPLQPEFIEAMNMLGFQEQQLTF